MVGDRLELAAAVSLVIAASCLALMMLTLVVAGILSAFGIGCAL